MPVAADPPGLALDALEKHYGAVAAINGVSLDVPRGAILALLGPSGCGKTTILRAIAGFVAPDRGTVRLAGRDVTALPPERRGTGMVFQNYALFPAHDGGGERGVRVAHAPGAPRGNGLAWWRRPWRWCSCPTWPGATRPSCPAASSSGPPWPGRWRSSPPCCCWTSRSPRWTRTCAKPCRSNCASCSSALGVTTVIVTHDQAEAMILADQVAVLRAGTVEQFAPPAAVYDHPATRFVAGFMGVGNILDAAPDGDCIRVGPFRMPPPAAPRLGAGPAAIAIRAEAVEIVPPGEPGGWPGRIAFASNLGGRLLYEVEVEGVGRLKVERPRVAEGQAVPVGTAVAVRVDPRHCTLLRD